MSYILKATTRVLRGDKSRLNGLIPAVVYSVGKTTQSIAVNSIEFVKLFREAGESSLIDLDLDGKNAGKVLVQDAQYDPVSDRVIHADFRMIDMTKRLQAKVVLRYVGEAPAVKEAGGTLVTNLNEVEIECLPADLIGHLDIDVTVLKTFDDFIKIKDLPLPAGVTIVSPHGDALVAKAQPAITEEEIKAQEEAAKSADVTKIEQAGKKKEEEPVEGEAAPAAEKKEEKKEEKK
ncbi:MAG: 50S ribosomal protein L25 [bacterium]|nr:50S ribosomal protein L25 [bacterium]